MRFFIAHQMGLLAGGLKVAENAFLNDGELRCLHAIVVIAARGKRARRSAVANKCAVIAGDALADFIRRDVTGARVVGFVAERPVELGRVRDALVNGEHEVVRHQDQILLARA